VNYLVLGDRQSYARGHIPDLFLLNTYSLGKLLSITPITTMKIIVAESFTIHIFELALELPITAIADQ
jgi:hypothetical protein